MAASPTPETIVAALGTSLTARGTWTTTLGERLSSRFGRPIEVRNLGIPGATCRVAPGQIARLGAARPAVVLIEYSANDASLHRGMTLRASRNRTSAIVDRLLAIEPPPAVCLLIMSPVLGWRGMLRPRLDRFHDLYGEIATRKGVWLIDTRAAWSAIPKAELWRLIPDGAHPLPDAVERIALPVIEREVGAALAHGWNGSVR